jgi:putative ABC transport system permease protein
VEFERPYSVLGSEVATKLFPHGSPLGKRIMIRGTHYQVIGVFKSQGSFLGQSRDVHVTIPIGRFRRAFGSRHSLDIGVRVAEGMDLEQASEELRGYMRRVRALRPTQEDNFAVNRSQEMERLYEEVTGGLYMVIQIISAISLLIGGISIMNIMMVSVTERTREIGVRKALGARRLSVLFQFLIESLVLAFIGGLIGLGGGFLVAHVVNSVSDFPASVPVYAVLVGLGFAVAVGLVFGVYPAWRASRLDPIEALRSE